MGNNIQANSIKKFPHLAAFDTVMRERFELLDFSVLMVYLIDSVPASALPFLAEQFDVLGYKGWKFADTEQKQRTLIKKAIELHRFKGTPWSIREALKIVGFDNTVIKERIQSNTYNGDWNHNGTIYYNAPHWATFRVIIDATQYGVLTTQQIADVIALVNEYKNARSQLLDVSMGYYLDDTPAYNDDFALQLDYIPSDDLSMVNYNGVFNYDGVANHDVENDVLEVLVMQGYSATFSSFYGSGQSVAIAVQGYATIKWGDGSHTSVTDDTASHTYASPGTYNVTIYGSPISLSFLSGNLTSLGVMPSSLTGIIAAGNKLTSFDPTGLIYCKDFDFFGNNLTTSAVDALIDFIAFSTVGFGGTADLSNQTPAAPPTDTGPGSAYEIATTAGWGITTD